MQININSALCEVKDNLSLGELLRLRQLSDRNLIVELNGEIIKGDWDKVILKSNDCLELVQMVFGG